MINIRCIFCMGFFAIISFCVICAMDDEGKLPLVGLKTSIGGSEVVPVLASPAISPRKRAAIVGFSAVVGIGGGCIARSRFPLVDGAARLVTFGRPLVFDIGCGVALGGVAWWVTREHSGNTLQELQCGFLALDRSVTALDATVAGGFKCVRDVLDVSKAKVEGVQSQVAVVAAGALATQEALGEVHHDLAEGFATIQAQCDAVERRIFCLYHDVARKQEKMAVLIGAMRQKTDIRFAGLIELATTTETQMTMFEREQDETKKLLMDIVATKQHNTSSIERLIKAMNISFTHQ